jgi:hypothetical protein
VSVKSTRRLTAREVEALVVHPGGKLAIEVARRYDARVTAVGRPEDTRTRAHALDRSLKGIFTLPRIPPAPPNHHRIVESDEAGANRCAVS